MSPRSSALQTLVAVGTGVPLFVVGGFGGGGRVIVDLLNGDSPPNSRRCTRSRVGATIKHSAGPLRRAELSRPWTATLSSFVEAVGTD